MLLDEHFIKGKQIVLTVHLPLPFEPITTNMKVVWIKENEEEFGPCKYNSGLSFVELDPDHLFMIKKFVRANSHKKIKE